MSRGADANQRGMALLASAPDQPMDWGASNDRLIKQLLADYEREPSRFDPDNWQEIRRLEAERDELVAHATKIQKERDRILAAAAALFQEAAQLGDAEGIWNLGWRYWLGEGVAKDPEAAKRWWQKAAAAGHAQSQRKLDELSRPTAATGQASRPEAALRDALTRSFTMDELRVLSFDVGIDFDDLVGATKTLKAQSLIEACLHLGQLPVLIGACQRLRPETDFPKPLS